MTAAIPEYDVAIPEDDSKKYASLSDVAKVDEFPQTTDDVLPEDPNPVPLLSNSSNNEVASEPELIQESPQEDSKLGETPVHLERVNQFKAAALDLDDQLKEEKETTLVMIPEDDEKKEKGYWDEVLGDTKELGVGTFEIAREGLTAFAGLFEWSGRMVFGDLGDEQKGLSAKDKIKTMHKYMQKYSYGVDSKFGKHVMDQIGTGITVMDKAVDKHITQPNLEVGNKKLADMGLVSYEFLKVFVGFAGARVAGIQRGTAKIQKNALQKQLEIRESIGIPKEKPLSKLKAAEETIQARKEITELGTKELNRMADDGLYVEPWELTSKQVTDMVKNKELKEPVRVAHEAIVENAIKLNEPVPHAVKMSVPSVAARFGQAGHFDAGLLYDLGAGVGKIIKDTSAGAWDVTKFLARPLFFSQTGGIRMLNTKTAKHIADLVSANPVSKKIVGPDFFQRTSRQQGRYLNKLQSAIEQNTNRFGKLSKKMNEQVVRGLRDNKAHISSRARKMVNEIRPILQDIRKKMVEAGLDVGEITNYFPRVYKTKRINRKRDDFIRFVESQGYDRATAGNATTRILQEEGLPQLARNKSERLTKDIDIEQYSGRKASGGVSKSHAEKSRSLEINERLAEPWLENDLMAVLPRYIEGAVRRTEYAKMFGPNEGKLNAMVKQVIKEANEQGRGGQHFQEAAVNRIYSLADQMQGSYKTFPSHLAGRFMKKANDYMAGYMVIRHLGWVAITSFPETMTTIARTGFNYKAFGAALSYGARAGARSASKLITGKYHFKKHEMAAMLEDLGVIAKAGFDMSVASRFAGKTGWVTNSFIKLTGLETLTNMQRVFAAKGFKDMIHGYAKDISVNSKSKASLSKARELKELGLNPDELALWHKGGKNNPVIESQIEYALIRGVNQVITKPNPGTTPAWMNNPYLKQVALFQRFNTAFSNVFLKKALTDLVGKKIPRKKAEILGSMAAMISIAYFAQFLREKLQDREEEAEDTSTQQRIVNAVDRSALTGHLTRFYALFVNPYKYGYKDDITSRAFSTLGPMAGDASRMYNAVRDKNDPGGKTAKQIAASIPLVTMSKEGLGPVPGREDVSENVQDLMDRWGFSDWLEDFNENDDE